MSDLMRSIRRHSTWRDLVAFARRRPTWRSWAVLALGIAVWIPFPGEGLFGPWHLRFDAVAIVIGVLPTDAVGNGGGEGATVRAVRPIVSESGH